MALLCTIYILIKNKQNPEHIVKNIQNTHKHQHTYTYTSIYISSITLCFGLRI